LKALRIYKACKAYGDKRCQDFEECQNLLDIYVVSYLTCYDGVQNFVDEDSHWWSYQWQNKGKVWFFPWCANFIEVHCYFPIVVINPRPN